MPTSSTIDHVFPGREYLLVLAGALARRRRVEITYRNISGKRTVRLVDPLAVHYEEGPWFVMGRCHLLRKPQGFRVDLIEKVRILRHASRPEDPVDPEVVRGWSEPRYARSNGGAAPSRATVRLEGPLARHAAVLFPGSLHELAADGALLCHLQVTDLQALGCQAFSLGKGATVTYPPMAKELMVVLDIMASVRSP